MTVCVSLSVYIMRVFSLCVHVIHRSTKGCTLKETVFWLIPITNRGNSPRQNSSPSSLSDHSELIPIVRVCVRACNVCKLCMYVAADEI